MALLPLRSWFRAREEPVHPSHPYFLSHVPFIRGNWLRPCAQPGKGFAAAAVAQ